MVLVSLIVWLFLLFVLVNIINVDIIVKCNYVLYFCWEWYYFNGVSSYIVYDG